MLYVFLFIVGIVAIGLYVTVILRFVPGAAEERLGVLEDLPADIGIWKVDESSPSAMAARTEGLIRQVRVWHEPARGLFGNECLIRQARYRNASTHEIVRVERDEKFVRKRVRG